MNNSSIPKNNHMENSKNCTFPVVHITPILQNYFHLKGKKSSNQKVNPLPNFYFRN